jgi:hypothetical protein
MKDLILIEDFFFNLEKRPLVGIEQFAHYFVIFLCGIFTILLLPWSLFFAVKVKELLLLFSASLKRIFSVFVKMSN